MYSFNTIYSSWFLLWLFIPSNIISISDFVLFISFEHMKYKDFSFYSLPILTFVSILGQFQLMIFSLLCIMFSYLFVWLLIFDWMPDMNYTYLSAGWLHIFINILEFVFRCSYYIYFFIVLDMFSNSERFTLISLIILLSLFSNKVTN